MALSSSCDINLTIILLIYPTKDKYTILYYNNNQALVPSPNTFYFYYKENQTITKRGASLLKLL